MEPIPRPCGTDPLVQVDSNTKITHLQAQLRAAILERNVAVAAERDRFEAAHKEVKRLQSYLGQQQQHQQQQPTDDESISNNTTKIKYLEENVKLQSARLRAMENILKLQEGVISNHHQLTSNAEESGSDVVSKGLYHNRSPTQQTTAFIDTHTNTDVNTNTHTHTNNTNTGTDTNNKNNNTNDNNNTNTNTNTNNNNTNTTNNNTNTNNNNNNANNNANTNNTTNNANTNTFEQLLRRWREKVFEVMVARSMMDAQSKSACQALQQQIAGLEQRVKGLTTTNGILKNECIDRDAELKLKINETEIANNQLDETTVLLKDAQARVASHHHTTTQIVETVTNANTKFNDTFEVVDKSVTKLNLLLRRVEFAAQRTKTIKYFTSLHQAREKTNQQDLTQAFPPSELLFQELEDLKAEMDRLQRERDFLVGKTQQDVESFNSRVESMRNNVEEELHASQTLTLEYKTRMETAEKEYHNQSAELQSIKSKLKDEEIHTATLQTQLEQTIAVSQINTAANEATLQASFETKIETMKTEYDEHTTKLCGEYEHKIADLQNKYVTSRRDEAKATARATQLEYDLRRQIDETTEADTTRSRQLLLRIAELEMQIKIVTTDRNTLIANLQRATTSSSSSLSLSHTRRADTDVDHQQHHRQQQQQQHDHQPQQHQQHQHHHHDQQQQQHQQQQHQQQQHQQHQQQQHQQQHQQHQQQHHDHHQQHQPQKYQRVLSMKSPHVLPPHSSNHLSTTDEKYDNQKYSVVPQPSQNAEDYVWTGRQQGKVSWQPAPHDSDCNDVDIDDNVDVDGNIHGDGNGDVDVGGHVDGNGKVVKPQTYPHHAPVPDSRGTCGVLFTCCVVDVVCCAYVVPCLSCVVRIFCCS